MKLISSYIKELIIAARGFYFYIEIGFSILVLLILLFAVNEYPVSKQKEYLSSSLPKEYTDAMVQQSIDKGNAEWTDDTQFTLKPASIDITDEQTGKVTTLEFEEEKIINVKTLKEYDPKTKELEATVHFFEDDEDMIRTVYSQKSVGAVIGLSDTGTLSYKYYLQGYETQRMVELLSVLNLGSLDELQAATEQISVRTLGTFDSLNNRQNILPVYLAFAGSIMGVFIVMAYIFLDKDEGVIKAFAVTPSSVWKYLLSKTMIIMTTELVCATILTIPIMGGQPNYLLFYPFLLVTTFAFASLGLLVSSFFDNISKSFGVIYAFMILLMLPVFSYFIPSFDPLWLWFFPTYPMLTAYKEILVTNGDAGYVLLYTGVFLAGGIILFLISNFRFKKTLTV